MRPGLHVAVTVGLICVALSQISYPADINKDGRVDGRDLAILADNWLWQLEKAGPGETIITHVRSRENGNIAVRIQVPESCRYPEGAPIVVVASTWFVKKFLYKKCPGVMSDYEFLKLSISQSEKCCLCPREAGNKEE